jgi:hypothetical protein
MMKSNQLPSRSKQSPNSSRLPAVPGTDSFLAFKLQLPLTTLRRGNFGQNENLNNYCDSF